jgi:hypothetical protein
MSTRTACQRASDEPSDQAGLPGCDTGPAGRLSFVIREAAAAWRSHRAHKTGRDNRADTAGEAP